MPLERQDDVLYDGAGNDNRIHAATIGIQNALRTWLLQSLGRAVVRHVSAFVRIGWSLKPSTGCGCALACSMADYFL
jgi:hypothetical protein